MVAKGAMKLVCPTQSPYIPLLHAARTALN